MLYSYFLTEKEKTKSEALEELLKSLDKAYELYISMLVLMIDMTDVQDLRLDQAKHKYLPSDEDLNPNTRFVENAFIQDLKKNEDLEAYLKELPISWRGDELFLKLMLDKVLNSEVYKSYMEAPGTSYKNDCEFWREIMKQVILKDEDLAEYLESKSVYWNDDLGVMGTFVLKTIKRFEETLGSCTIQKMYKDDEDRNFGKDLFNRAVMEREDNERLIEQFVKKEHWEVDRIAFMDKVIMGLALSEIKDFDAIPTRVSLNEYIEIAKYYSTPKSGQYINGILNSAINYLKKEGRIAKD